MEPNKNLPDDVPGRTITIRLTRDSMILVAALAFLGFAILLAIFFPPDRASITTSATIPVGTSGAPTSTAPAIPPPTQVEQAILSAPEVAAASRATLAPAYPAPEAPPTAAPADQPIFDPVRPTGEIPTPSFLTETTAELLPTTAPLPTLAPPTPTLLPPVAIPTIPPTATPGTISANFQQRPVQPRDGIRPTTAPTAAPLEILRGTNYWTVANSPLLVKRDTVVANGSALIIEPGVEIRMAPGVSLFVEGKLYALGKPGRGVRIIGSETRRWEGIFGQVGSDIVLENTEIHGGGAGGTLILSQGGSLALRGARITDNGGHIRAEDTRIEIRDSEITANDMPYGAALDLTYNYGGFATLINNRIGGNRMAQGSAPVLISHQSSVDIINLEIQRNLLVGQDGPNLAFDTNGVLQGNISCNALVGGSNGLSIRSSLPQVPALPLRVRDNAIEKHTPPIIPIYLQFGIGRGATSDVALDMSNNWWGNTLGPYEPDRHADGRGDAPGDTITFIPWRTTRPDCAPHQ